MKRVGAGSAAEATTAYSLRWNATARSTHDDLDGTGRCAMSFGPFFTLRTRGPVAEPRSANRMWAAMASWFDRRAPRPAAPGEAEAMNRRADDQPARPRELR